MAPKPKSTPAKPRPLARWMLGVALAASMLFAAWQIAIALLNRHDAPKAPRRPPAILASSQPADARGDDVMSQLAQLNPAQLDPLDLTPPKDALRLYAFTRPIDGREQTHAAYRAEGPLDEVAQHYRNQLLGAGLNILRDEERDGRRTILASTDNADCVVLLHRRDAEGKIVRVVVTATLDVPPHSRKD